MTTKIAHIYLNAGSYSGVIDVGGEDRPFSSTTVVFTASAAPATGAVGTVITITTNGPFTAIQAVRNGLPVSGASATGETTGTYTTVSADIGADLRFVVTPLGVQEPAITNAVAVTGSSFGVTFLGTDVISSGTDSTGPFNFTGKTLGTGTIIVSVGVQHTGAQTFGAPTVAGEDGAFLTDGTRTANAATATGRAAIFSAPCTSATGTISVPLASGSSWGCHVSWWLVTGAWEVEEVRTFGDGLTAPWTRTANIPTTAGGAVFLAAQNNRNGALDYDNPQNHTQRGVFNINGRRGTSGDNLSPGTNAALAVGVGDSNENVTSLACAITSIREAV